MSQNYESFTFLDFFCALTISRMYNVSWSYLPPPITLGFPQYFLLLHWCHHPYFLFKPHWIQSELPPWNMSSLRQPSVVKSLAYICAGILNRLTLVIAQITVAAVGSDKLTSCPEGSISQHPIITYSRHFGQLRVSMLTVDCCKKNLLWPRLRAAII